MNSKTRLAKLEKAVTTGEETNNLQMEITVIITDRRDVLRGEAEPDESLGDRIEKHTVPIFTSQVKSF